MAEMKVMFDQKDIFAELFQKFVITKPIKLIELFAGIGSQAKSLERLGVPFEHHKVVEFDKYCIRSYNAIHGTNFEPSDIVRSSDMQRIGRNPSECRKGRAHSQNICGCFVEEDDKEID